MSDIGWLDSQLDALVFVTYALGSLVYLVFGVRRALHDARGERTTAGFVVGTVMSRTRTTPRILEALTHVLLLGLALAWWRHRDGPAAVPFVPVSMLLGLATLWPLRSLVRATPLIVAGRLTLWVSRQGTLLVVLNVALLSAVCATRWGSWAAYTMGKLTPETFAWVGLLAASLALGGIVHGGLVVQLGRRLRSAPPGPAR